MIIKIREIFNRKLCRYINNTDITMEQLKRKQANGAVIIDVRSPQEFAEGHIEGAILIPEYDIVSKIQGRINNKNEEIVLYCSSGIRSKRAQKKLKEMGYKNIYNLKF